MIEESYVSFKTARLLKEAGFDVECYWFYINDGSVDTGIVVRSTSPRDHNMGTGFLSRPTLALAARWLREVHKVHISSEIMVYPVLDRVGGKEVGERISWGYYVIPTERGTPIVGNDEEFNTYESALEAGLKHGLEVIKSWAYEDDDHLSM